MEDTLKNHFIYFSTTTLYTPYTCRVKVTHGVLTMWGSACPPTLTLFKGQCIHIKLYCSKKK